MRKVLLAAAAVVSLAALDARATPATPSVTVPMSSLLDVSRVRTSATNRQVLLMPDASRPGAVQSLELRVVRPAKSGLHGDVRCKPRVAAR